MLHFFLRNRISFGRITYFRSHIFLRSHISFSGVLFFFISNFFCNHISFLKVICLFEELHFFLRNHISFWSQISFLEVAFIFEELQLLQTPFLPCINSPPVPLPHCSIHSETNPCTFANSTYFALRRGNCLLTQKIALKTLSFGLAKFWLWYWQKRKILKLHFRSKLGLSPCSRWVRVNRSRLATTESNWPCI